MQTQTDRSAWQIIAAKRYPLSSDCGNIRGDGRYVLVSKCFHRWKVLLFANAADRDARDAKWFGDGCGHPSCRGDHFTFNLSL